MLTLKKLISVCESKENKRDFFFNHETYTKIIVIDLIIVKLFEICLMIFLFKKGFSRKFCVIVCNCYFELLILLIILFETQHIRD